MSLAEWDAMILSQEGRCAICRTQLIKAHLDHSHTNGKARGVLCHLCNKGLGVFFDNTLFLEAAIVYLKGAP